MINAVSLRNVRVFRKVETPFQLADLSVFCGTNSSGKSSILKSILLLRQSQGIEEPVRARNGLLRFVGTQVDLGHFPTYVSDRNTDREITIGLSVPHALDKNQVSFLRSITKATSHTQEPPIQEERPQATIDVRFTFLGVPNRKKDVPLSLTSGHGQNVEQLQGVLNNASFTINTATETLLSWYVYKNNDAKSEEPSYKLRMPSKYFEEVGGSRFLDVDPSPVPEHVELTVVLDGLLPSRVFARVHQEKGKQDKKSIEAKEQWTYFPLPPQMEKAIESLRIALTNIHYMGPLRAPAKRYYVTGSDSPPTMDPAGEFLPYLLALQEEPQVVFIPPRQTKPQKLGLYAALDQWLYFIRMGETIQAKGQHELRVSSLKGVLVELEVLSPNDSTPHSLADSGFGYSQLLPILVRCLMSTRKSTIIVEQPELHLNPAVQLRLAEFFISLVLAGKQVLLETHSEHMVNAVRVLVAEEEKGNLVGRCSIFYIRASADGPQVQRLPIDANGSVFQWPYEFFGEAAYLVGRLLRAQKRFRKSTATRE